VPREVWKVVETKARKIGMVETKTKTKKEKKMKVKKVV